MRTQKTNVRMHNQVVEGWILALRLPHCPQPCFYRLVVKYQARNGTRHGVPCTKPSIASISPSPSSLARMKSHRTTMHSPAGQLQAYFDSPKCLPRQIFAVRIWSRYNGIKSQLCPSNENNTPWEGHCPVATCSEPMPRLPAALQQRPPLPLRTAAAPHVP